VGGGGLERYKKYSYNKGVWRENLETPCCDGSLAKPMRFSSYIFWRFFHTLPWGLVARTWVYFLPL
jgi:hypothetical protein